MSEEELIKTKEIPIKTEHKLSKNIYLYNTRSSVQYITMSQGNHTIYIYIYNSVALVRKRTIPTERPPQVGEVSANFCG